MGRSTKTQVKKLGHQKKQVLMLLTLFGILRVSPSVGFPELMNSSASFLLSFIISNCSFRWVMLGFSGSSSELS